MAIDKQPEPQPFLIDKLQVQELEHSWMRCPSGKIPDLFYACFTNGAGQYETHRAIAYSMPTEVLREAEKPSQPEKLPPEEQRFELRVHMGCDPDNPPGDALHRKPPFTPFLSVHDKTGKQKKYYRLEWDREADFFKQEEAPGQHFGTPIAKETALEFLYGWCNCAYHELAAPFEGKLNRGGYIPAASFVARVNHYFFEKDSDDIVGQIEQADKLSLLLGIGHSRNEAGSPFRFKPIIHLSRKNGQDGAANLSVATYEFSNPCPPICGGGGSS